MVVYSKAGDFMISIHIFFFSNVTYIYADVSINAMFCRNAILI